MLQPQGQQSLEAATLCDPRSCLSLEGKAHFPWGTVLEQSQGQALPVTWGLPEHEHPGARLLSLQSSPALSVFLIHIQCFVLLLHQKHILPWGLWPSNPTLVQVYPLLCPPVCLWTEPCKIGWQPPSRFFFSVQWCKRWEVAELPPVFPANPFPALMCVAREAGKSPSQGGISG